MILFGVSIGFIIMAAIELINPAKEQLTPNEALAWSLIFTGIMGLIAWLTISVSHNGAKKP